jgi:hypothetical protein
VTESPLPTSQFGHGLPHTVSLYIFNHVYSDVKPDFSGISSIAQYSHIAKWFEHLLQRPGFEAGRNVPRAHFHITLNDLPEDELDQFAEAGKKWQKEARDMEAAA